MSDNKIHYDKHDAETVLAALDIVQNFLLTNLKTKQTGTVEWVWLEARRLHVEDLQDKIVEDLKR